MGNLNKPENADNFAVEDGEQEKITQEKLVMFLDNLGKKISKKRADAIDFRKSCGVEHEWTQDEEFYEGIDDANRREFQAWDSKPLGTSAGLTTEEEKATGSTIFLNITRPYVDAVAARIADMLFPIDDVAFKIKPTPKVELLNMAKGKLPNSIRAQIGAATSSPEEAAKVEQDMVDKAKKMNEDAKAIADKIQNQIEDWHVECQYHAQGRRLLEDVALAGTGVLKGPVPVKRSKMVYVDGDLGMVDEIKPASHRVDYRNVYPDPACGENIHDGDFIFERDDITRSCLIKLIDTPGYIEPQIRKVIQEGPMLAARKYQDTDPFPGLQADKSKAKSLFEIWYYHGIMKTEDLKIMDFISGSDSFQGMRELETNREDTSENDSVEGQNPVASGDSEQDNLPEYVYVQLTMVNNRVIKASTATLQTGEFPYDIMVWQRRKGLPWGRGVARQIRAPQRIVLGAIRHMMDNAGVAGGPMLFMNSSLMQPADGVFEIKPWKIYIPADNVDMEVFNANEAFQMLKIPMFQEELQRIIELGLRMAEDVTGMPMIMLGQTNPRTPDTLGGMTIQNNNASTVLRRIARQFDDSITEPHVQRYYNFILEYGEDDSMKGEFSVDAIGSTSLIERDMANNAVANLANFVLDPRFKIDPAKWMKELLVMNKLDPKRFNFDDEEWEQLVAQLAQKQGGGDEAKYQNEEAKRQFEAEKSTMEMAFKAKESEKDRDLEMAKAAMQARTKQEDQSVKAVIAKMQADVDMMIAQMREQGASERQLQDVKQKLEQSVMELTAQIQLNGTEIATPAIEPAGRAPEGQSFEK